MPSYDTLSQIEQQCKERAEAKAKAHANSFEVGDLVSTVSGHAGIVDWYSEIIDKNGYGERRRFYRVRVVDSDYVSFESQSGEFMTKLPLVEEVFGEGYLA